VRVILFLSNHCRAGTFQFVFFDWIFLDSICLISFGVVVCIALYEFVIMVDYQIIYIFLFIKN